MFDLMFKQEINHYKAAPSKFKNANGKHIFIAFCKIWDYIATL